MKPLKNVEIENLSLVVLIPRLVFTIVFQITFLIFYFWLRLGEFTMLSVGFGLFVSTVEVLYVVGIRFYNRTEVHVSKPIKWDWMDKLGGF